MKGFGIEIKNNLLESKHIEHMGVAVWLYMWCIDKMTSINEQGIGKVLGGKPIRYEKDIKPELGISLRTYRRWIIELRASGYIQTTRTPIGLSIFVNKAFKRFKKRDVPQMAKRCATNGTSDVPHTAHPIKTVSVDNTKTRDAIAKIRQKMQWKK